MHSKWKMCKEIEMMFLFDQHKQGKSNNLKWNVFFYPLMVACKTFWVMIFIRQGELLTYGTIVIL